MTKTQKEISMRSNLMTDKDTLENEQDYYSEVDYIESIEKKARKDARISYKLIYR